MLQFPFSLVSHLCLFLPIQTTAGAKKVIAIECSGIAEQAQQIMDSNPHYGNKIEIIQAKCEDIDELPDGITEVVVDNDNMYLAVASS